MYMNDGNAGFLVKKCWQSWSALVRPAVGSSIHDIDFSLDIFIEVKVEFASEKDRIHRKSEIAQLCGEASSKSEQVAKCLKCGGIFLYVNLYQNIAEILTVCYNRIMKFAGVFDK